MSEQVLILTEGGKDVGLGHLSRCSALYQAFAQKGASPVLVVNGEEHILDFIPGLQCHIQPWLDKDVLLSLLQETPDIAVVDSYLAGEDLYQIIARKCKVAVYMDDNKRMDYPPGIVVNSAGNAEALGYPPCHDKVYLLTEKYALLRAPFWQDSPRRAGQALETILLTMGGSDMRNLTPKILQVLTQEYPQAEKIVIVGHGFSRQETMSSWIDDRTQIVQSPDAEALRALMLQADMAVSAGGQTLYELTRCGVPACVVCVADNQASHISWFQEKGLVKDCGRYDASNLSARVRQALGELADEELRSRISAAGRKIVDGRGALRLVDEILKYLPLQQHY